MLVFCLLVHSISCLQAQGEWIEHDPESLDDEGDAASLNLNTTEAPVLRRLTGLSEEKVRAVIRYRETFGAFLSPLELQVVDGLNQADIRKILTWCFIPEAEIIPVSNSRPGEMVFRFRLRRDDLSYKNGIPFYSFWRLQFKKSDKHRWAILAENDAGEPYRWSPRNGYFGADHVSGFYERSIGPRHRLTFGNFNIHFGQGLLSGDGFMLGKGRYAVEGIGAPQTGVFSYRGLRENGVLSGMAVAGKSDRWRYGAFAGQTTYSSRIYHEDGPRFFRTPGVSGYHRTESERDKRKSISRYAAGGYFLTRITDGIEAGMLWQNDWLSLPHLAGTGWEENFAWSGRRMLSASVFLRMRFRQWYGWIEYARNASGYAWQSGILASLGRQWSAALLVRNYAPGYLAFDARAFGERTSRPENEQGIYFGVTYSPQKHWLISAYSDIYRYPWASFRHLAPAYGNELYLGSQFRISSGMSIATEFRDEVRTTAIAGSPVRNTRQVRTRLAGILLTRQLSHSLEWRFRIRWKTVLPDKMYGTGAYQEIIFRKTAWQISYRFTWFRAPDYAARIYFYERDFSFSIPALQGEGLHQYLMVRRRLATGLDIWLRYSVTRFFRNNNDGPSSWSVQNLVSCQLKIKF